MARKLIEVLVIESQLKDQSKVTMGELGTTFDKKRHLFESKRKTLTPIGDGVVTVEEESDIQTTIEEELAWIAGITSKQIDTSYTVAQGNMDAEADVVLDSGRTLLADVPATALLELDKRVSEIRELIKRVPTLDPAKGFQPDSTHAKRGVSKARDITKKPTHKIQKPLVLYPATDKHPAQVQMISEDVVIGTRLEQEWSALITPSRKAQLIERTEELSRAIKRAQARANSIEVQDAPTIGKTLWDFVLGA